MIQTGINGLLRFGHVNEYDASRHMARVSFPGQSVISGWLPVLVPCSNGNTVECHVDIGTHVACIMAGEGSESGVILGAFYDDTNRPVLGDENITVIKFSDGSYIMANRAEHSIEIYSADDINIYARGNVSIRGSRIDLN